MNGQSVWIHQASTNQSFATRAQVPAALSFLTGAGQFASTFHFTMANLSFPGGYVLLGDPVKPTPGVKKALFWVDAQTSQIRRVTLVDAQSNQNQFDFTGVSLKDSKTGKPIQIGDLIVAYFQGIDSVIGKARAGVYGTYTVVHQLFDRGLIGYGWQQTFGNHQNDPHDPRAQLRQYDIYPDQTGWGVSGAGALDLDRAVHPKFGQW